MAIVPCFDSHEVIEAIIKWLLDIISERALTFCQGLLLMPLQDLRLITDELVLGNQHNPSLTDVRSICRIFSAKEESSITSSE
jgi:hypothetical protein